MPEMSTSHRVCSRSVRESLQLTSASETLAGPWLCKRNFLRYFEPGRFELASVLPIEPDDLVDVLSSNRDQAASAFGGSAGSGTTGLDEPVLFVLARRPVPGR